MEIQTVQHSLNELYQELLAKNQKTDNETQSISQEMINLSKICLLPKQVLRSIFLFTDFYSDIPAISETCVLFNKLVRSRSFNISVYKIASQRASRMKSTTINADALDKLEAQKLVKDNISRDEALLELKKANAVKDFLADKMKKQDKKIESLLEEIDKLNDQVIPK